ncbi:hypothetical protein GCM10008164_34550 [Achromobacter xylosoxidans]|nr:hypothetical protein GCM10008164_34550 [Achromobacter xylosoxidans]
MAGVFFQQPQQHELQIVGRDLAAAGPSAAVVAEAAPEAAAFAVLAARTRKPVTARGGVALMVRMALAMVAVVLCVGMGMAVAARLLLAGTAHECGKKLGITHG